MARVGGRLAWAAALALGAGATLLGACRAAEGLPRGVYEATQERERSKGDPPADLPPTYDEYERFRKKSSGPGAPP